MTAIFISAHILIAILTIIFYAQQFFYSESAQQKKIEKRKMEFFRKASNDLWEETERPYISYKSTKN